MAALGALTVLYLARADAGHRADELHRGPDPELPAARASRSQWYEQMVTDRQWSTGIVNSLQVAFAHNDPRHRARHACRAWPGPRALLRPVAGQRARAVAADRARRHDRDRAVRAVRALAAAGSLVGLVLAHTVLALPFVLSPVATSLRTMDRNLELAAANLGAGPRRTFVTSPSRSSCRASLAGAIFAFITSWDEVVVAIFITSARSARCRSRSGAGRRSTRPDRCGHLDHAAPRHALCSSPSSLIVRPPGAGRGDAGERRRPRRAGARPARARPARPPQAFGAPRPLTASTSRCARASS